MHTEYGVWVIRSMCVESAHHIWQSSAFSESCVKRITTSEIQRRMVEILEIRWKKRKKSASIVRTSMEKNVYLFAKWRDKNKIFIAGGWTHKWKKNSIKKTQFRHKHKQSEATLLLRLTWRKTKTICFIVYRRVILNCKILSSPIISEYMLRCIAGMSHGPYRCIG